VTNSSKYLLKITATTLLVILIFVWGVVGTLHVIPNIGSEGVRLAVATTVVCGWALVATAIGFWLNDMLVEE
jgi:hypothetical protein